jgi:hypothetical protein
MHSLTHANTTPNTMLAFFWDLTATGHDRRHSEPHGRSGGVE